MDDSLNGANLDSNLSEGLGPQSAQHGTVVGDLVVHLEVGTCKLITLF
jgi:hypothetical protein